MIALKDYVRSTGICASSKMAVNTLESRALFMVDILVFSLSLKRLLPKIAIAHREFKQIKHKVFLDGWMNGWVGRWVG